MVLFFLVSLINAALHNEWLLMHRLHLGSVPINLLDGLVGISFVLSAIYAQIDSTRFRAPVHPAMIISVLLLAFTLVAGLIGNSMQTVATYNTLLEIRDLLMIPLFAVATYLLVRGPASFRFACFALVFAGIVGAFAVMLSFGQQASTKGTNFGFSVTNIREVKFGTYYPGLVACFLLFVYMCSARFMLRWILILAGITCFLGSWATLSRTDWLCSIVTLVASIFLFQRGERLRRIFRLALITAVLGISLFLAATLASSAAGQDVRSRLFARLWTMVPGVEATDHRDGKAWDTRLPGMIRELQLWKESPLIGQGFAHTRSGISGELANFGGGRHNVWTSSLATFGIIGFAAMLFPLIAMMVIGRRMVRQYLDTGSMLVGALGFLGGVYAIMLGMCTMSLNVQRGGIWMAGLMGLVFRARAIQLQMIRQYQGHFDEETWSQQNLSPLIGGDAPMGSESDDLPSPDATADETDYGHAFPR